jgi:hypothetical protein
MAERDDLEGLTNLLPVVESEFILFEEEIKKTGILIKQH